MKSILFAVILCCLPGGDRERGLALYREGKFAEAAAAFRAAIADHGDAADLQWNLALACWRSGDLTGAETAVEKYAALAGDARTELHAGLLGAVRFDEAKALEAEADAAMAPPMAAPGAPAAPNAPAAVPADPLPRLEQALQKAEQARDWFVKGASAKATPELLRNTERALRYVDALKKKIEELKQQREQQKDQQEQKQSNDQKDDNQQKNEQEKPEEPKPETKPEPESKDEKKPSEDDKQQPKQDEKQSQQQQGEPKPDEQGQERPEPQQGGEPKPEPEPQQGGKPQPDTEGGKDDAKAPEPRPGEAEPQPAEQGDEKGRKPEPRQDAPGEVAEGKELSPEQQQRLMDALQELDQKLKAYRARAKSGRRPVERDW